ncbi:sigma-54 dependent transcriptional regulator [Acidiferrobacter thiooxydans]|jgi:two-component system response regulator PilR (NtrC family)|uniref:sigma-54-dependent transcriptional regulator n=1 Tax=Acidiferrobacter thiooxydans TaxID=163359 RepID=UPI000826DE59|nr:sigma-54 dependent transcriptional regulator [Acidiferrobacter thiooxydans]UEN99018.1 sigma-54 dependent transcriptional regulator [Acidiferrobacter thiooxydans]
MTIPQVLIIDDEADIRALLELTLGRMNIETRSAGDVASAFALLEEYRFDLCLTDMRLPDGDGLAIVRHIEEHHRGLPVAVITAHGSMETAIAALKGGAFDFVCKPLNINELRALVRSALNLSKQAPSDGASAAAKLLGDSQAIREVRALIERLARGQAPVYISGESGTGKELAARLIHDLGPRAGRPFVAVNCGAIPEQLMESEFFGHKKGSFTGAFNDKDGLFKTASGGTLFLDEVGDLPVPMQVKLLRAIQEKAVRPVGSQQEVAVDVRILSATHKNLHDLVRTGAFRQDLYYRLNVIELVIPPLRERAGDIPALAAHLAAKLSMGRPLPLTPAALAALKRYAFPGNVRELENIMERALTLCESGEIDVADLRLPGHDAPGLSGKVAAPEASPFNASDYTGEQSLEEHLVQVERAAIEKALRDTNQNKTAAARELGITFRALRYKLEKLGIE